MIYYQNTKLTATSSGQLITVSNDYYDLVLSTTEGHWYIQNNICFALVSLECKTPSDSKWVTVAKLPKNCKYPKNLISSVKSGSSKYVKSLFLQPVGSEIWVQGGDAGAWYWVSITFPV